MPDKVNASLKSDSVNKAVIWRGFSHSWIYNHRLNRLGDFVNSNGEYNCDNRSHIVGSPISVHTAASGTGADVASSVSYFSKIESSNLEFVEEKIVIDLEGKERESITKNVSIKVKIADNVILENNQFTVLLNGFDLFVDGSKAQKPITFGIAIRDVNYNNNSINFNIHAEIKADCSSVECLEQAIGGIFYEHKIDYKLVVYYILVYSKEEMNYVTKNFERKVNWDKEYIILSTPKSNDYDTLELINGVIKGKDNNRFDKSFLGIKGFIFKMSDEFHFLKWSSFVIPENYDAFKGEINFKVGIHYQTWEKDMKNLFAFSAPGTANLELEISMIQFKSDGLTKIKNDKRNGKISWPGDNKSPKSCEAFSISPIN